VPAGGRAALALALVPALLWFDRGAAAAVAETVRGDLWLRDFELGLLASAPALLVALAAPAYGALAARIRRPAALAAGALVWSAATVLAAEARTHATLLAARAAAGIGAAAAVALAPGLLEERRGPAVRRSAARLLALPLGCAVGYALAGVVSARLGWRAALLATAAPGVLLAAACFRASDVPPGDAARAWSALRDDGFAGTARRIAGRPGATSGLAGLAAYAFGASALVFWLPSFLERVRGVSRRFGGLEAGIVLLMAGVAGVLAGDAALTALRPPGRRGERWLPAAATLAAALLVLVAVFARRPASYLPAFVGALLALAAAAPAIAAAVARRAASGPDRAAAIALAVLAAQAAGDAPAAAAVGALSDARSLWWALLVVPAALAASSAAFALAAWRGRASP
jgi:predicted MFS family arabinose efflux permease